MADDPKKKNNRSPNHPSLPLETAIDKAKLLHDKYGKEPAPLLAACKTMGYNSVYSTSNQAVAALKAYGLVDTSGKMDDRKVYVTDAGERIIRNAPNRAELIEAAALAPEIHRELWNEYKGRIPHKDILRQYLVWDRTAGATFNEDAVDGFMSRFRDTLTYAKLIGDDKKNNENGSGGDRTGGKNKTDQEEHKSVIQVGSFVQWTCQGVDQFKDPQKVLGISDDREFAFVESTTTGLPMSELSVLDPPVQQQPPVTKAPPTNPYFRAPEPTGPRIEFPLPGDNMIEIRLRKAVSKDDFERIKKLLELSEGSLVAPQ